MRKALILLALLLSGCLLDHDRPPGKTITVDCRDKNLLPTDSLPDPRPPGMDTTINCQLGEDE